MAKWDPPHVIHRVKSCLYTNVLGLLLHFSGKSTIFGLFITKRVWPYRYAHDIPLVTLIQNVNGFLGLAPVFFFFFPCPKYHFWLFFKYKKWCGHVDMLIIFPCDTDSKYMWVCGPNFNHSSVNHSSVNHGHRHLLGVV